MTTSLRDRLVFEAFDGTAFVEMQAPVGADIVAFLKQPRAWHEGSVHPKDGAEFPRVLASFHEGHGFILQCFETPQSWSDFLVTSERLSTPRIEIELGGQTLERWPPELFVPEELAVNALDWFLSSGREAPNCQWVRIDDFPRDIVWEGAAERDRWEQSRQSPSGDA